MLRRHALVTLAPPDRVFGGCIANNELVICRPPGVAARFDDKRTVLGKNAFAAVHGMLDQGRRNQVPMQMGSGVDTLFGKSKIGLCHGTHLFQTSNN